MYIYLIVKESHYIRIWDIWLLEFFLNSGNLICRSTGISMYFRESLGVRDNESRLYLFKIKKTTKKQLLDMHYWIDLSGSSL